MPGLTLRQAEIVRAIMMTDAIRGAAARPGASAGSGAGSGGPDPKPARAAPRPPATEERH